MKERSDAGVSATKLLKTIANNGLFTLGMGQIEGKNPQATPSGLVQRNPSVFTGQAGEGITVGKGPP